MFRRPHPAERGRGVVLQVAAAESRILAAGSRPLAYGVGPGTLHLLSPAAAELLVRLEGCRPVAAEGWHPAVLAAALEELQQQGLLVSREVLLRALRQPPDPGQPPQIAAVAWVTHARPAALGRSIRSFAANAARHGRAPAWLVFDDGDGQEAAQTLETLKPLAAGGLRLSYCGPEQKERMAARLAQATGGAVPAEVARSALFGLPGYGTTCGANRNAAVLATAGAPLLEADDDTVCELALHPDFGEGLSITSERDPSDLLCFDDRAALLETVRRADADFLAAHESVLGRAAGDGLLHTWPPGRIDLSEVSPALAALLVRGKGWVAATTGGAYGDVVVNDPAWLLWVEGDARARMVASEEAFRRARRTREVLRCPPMTAIGDSDLLFGVSLGLDGRAMLPPFLPMGRGEDLLFAQTLRLCLAEALVGRPALALLHDPVEWRSDPKGDQAVRGGAQAFDFIALLQRSRTFPAWVRTPEERLGYLGDALAGLGRLSVRELADAIAPVVLSARAAQLCATEGLLRRHSRMPRYWAAEVERYLEAMQEQIAERPVTPADVPRGGTDEETLEAFRAQLLLYGELLQAWPSIWRAARELAAAGPWGLVDLA